MVTIGRITSKIISLCTEQIYFVVLLRVVLTPFVTVPFNINVIKNKQAYNPKRALKICHC